MSQESSLVDQHLQHMMHECLKHKPASESMTRLPYSHVYRNSVNIYCGKQSSGKTYSCLQEIIKLCRYSADTHMLLYVNKTGTNTDATFECIKPLITVPVVYVSHDRAESYMQQLLLFKHMYNDVVTAGAVSEMPPDVRQEMSEVLHVSDFSRPYLHTLVLLDDTAQSQLISRDSSYFNQLLTQCRHVQCSFFMCVQYWKSINANTKSNASTVWVFSGYSRQQLNYIYYQLSLTMPFEEVYDLYVQLGHHRKLICDLTRGMVVAA